MQSISHSLTSEKERNNFAKKKNVFSLNLSILSFFLFLHLLKLSIKSMQKKFADNVVGVVMHAVVVFIAAMHLPNCAQFCLLVKEGVLATNNTLLLLRLLF
jgi:hypothetical protein